MSAYTNYIHNVMAQREAINLLRQAEQQSQHNNAVRSSPCWTCPPARGQLCTALREYGHVLVCPYRSAQGG